MKNTPASTILAVILLLLGAFTAISICFIGSFADYLGGAGQTHGEHGDGRTGERIFQAQSLLKGVEIFGVEDGGEGGAIDSAVFLHGIFSHIAGVGHLLCENNDV